MYFDNFSEFIAMGGHARYVWSSYLIALVVFTLNILLPLMARSRFFIEQSRHLGREKRLGEATEKSEANNAPGS